MDKEEIENQAKLIAENYDIIFTNVGDFEKKHLIGDTEDKICRFCGRKEPDVSFDTVAHAIPECLGNKKIICLDECDTCNQDFSKNVEDHLDKITLPFRTINMIKGKKKIPTYKSQNKNQKDRVEVKDHKKRLMEITVEYDSDFIQINSNQKTIKMEYNLQTHIPAAAYKALVKMALSVMPKNELQNYQHMLRWINEDDHTKAFMSPLIVFSTFVPGINPFKHTTVFLFKRKNTNSKYPECTFALAFGNILYQIVIPSDEEIQQGVSTKTILKLLTPFEIDWELGKVGHSILDWSETTVVKAKKQSFSFSYDEMKKQEINKE